MANVNRNEPMQYPNEKEFREKWLRNWTDDWESQSKIQEKCDQYLARVKSLPTTERVNEIIPACINKQVSARG